ncbi:hypothetical protein SLS62_003342 [Diatrype stigma]|uniref:Uncharacterized protein n=1 Tax=Diatrype stigma TaxID=117547 RepID=A0AAN9UWV1_9PEZI
MSSPQVKVDILIRECYAALRRTDGKSRAAARREYYEALTQADRALELALEGGLDGGLVRQCEILQGFCENSLRSAYAAKFDTYERLVYERAAAAADSSRDSSDSGSDGDNDSDEESSGCVSSGTDEEGEDDRPRELSSKRLRKV